MADNVTFYKEKEFKDTEIGKIPKEWEVVKLGEIASDIYYGITAKAVNAETKLKMLRTTDIKNYKVNWNALPFCKITEKREDIERFLLNKGDLMISRAGTIGISVLVDRDFENVVFGSYLIKVRLSNQIFPNFMYYFFQSRSYWDHITSGQSGSTLKNISLPILKSLKVPIPPLPEQQQIALILSTIDEAIQKTDEVTAKTERLKKGMMNKLLTKGIGHKEFKDTEIGRIPKEWEVKKITDLFEIVTGTTPSTKDNRYWKNGTVVWITPSDMSKLGGKIYINDSERRITERALREVNLTLMPVGSIILSTRAPIGYVTIIASPATFNQGCKGLIPTRSQLLPEFFAYYLLKKKPFLESLSGGSTFKELSKDALGSISLPHPKFPEQQQIASILSTMDEKLELLRKEKAKLVRVKGGFMKELLTGKIRVKS